MRPPAGPERPGKAALRLGCLLLLFSACAAPVRRDGAPPAVRDGSPPLAEVTVRVFYREEPLPGARVSWSASPLPGEKPAAVAWTDARGIAVGAVPAGRLFLSAVWRRDGNEARPIAAGDRFAWFGGNPVHIAAGVAQEIFLSLEEFQQAPAPVPAPDGSSGVSGRVTAAGAPAAQTHVFAYLRPGGGFRDMGFAASSPAGPDGEFALDLPPGAYWLVARRRAGGGMAGPLRKGDAFGYFAGNPVVVEPGWITRVILPVTVLKLRNPPVYSEGSGAAAFLEGRILGRDGSPRRGVYAALYDNPDLLNRPVFLSDVTGEDGRYVLPVPVPGTYFLGARNGYGGSPAPGDLYGRYEGNPEHAVTVRAGERLSGIDLVVDEVR